MRVAGIVKYGLKKERVMLEEIMAIVTSPIDEHGNPVPCKVEMSSAVLS